MRNLNFSQRAKFPRSRRRRASPEKDRRSFYGCANSTQLQQYCGNGGDGLFHPLICSDVIASAPYLRFCALNICATKPGFALGKQPV